MNFFKFRLLSTYRPHNTHLPEWTAQKQQELLNLISQHKQHKGNWPLVSQYVRDIPIRYSAKWTPQETDRLRQHIQTEYRRRSQKMDWPRIGKYMGRSPSACFLRFYQQTNKPNTPDKPPPMEVYQDKDGSLAKAIQDNMHSNTVQWDRVSKIMQADLLQVLRWVNSNSALSRLVPMDSLELSIKRMLRFIQHHIPVLTTANWPLISLYMCMPKIQCMEIYHRHLKQSTGIRIRNNTRWTDEELDQLNKVTSRLAAGQIDWNKVSHLMGGNRSPQSYQAAYRKLQQEQQVTGLPWDTKDLDQIKQFLIRQLRDQSGDRRVLQQVCQMFPHRTKSDVRKEVRRIRQQIISQSTRLYSKDMPRLLQLAEGQQDKAVDWREVARAMGSTASLCRKKYEMLMARKSGRREWTAEEVERLCDAVGNYSEKIDWYVVGQLVGTRSPDQCYIKHRSFTRRQ